MNGPRLVAVFGYSGGRATGLHPVCLERLALAAAEAGPEDAVLLSGWARRGHSVPEAELMARAWRGAAGTVVLDRRARTTYGNAVGTAATARRLRAREVVLVTSGWHGRRASALVRAALRDTGLVVRVAPTRERGTRVARLREVLCWPLVPVLAVAAGRKR
jgi:uncharacterized SAM-binding protein YcdF (DUF218 family)